MKIDLEEIENILHEMYSSIPSVEYFEQMTGGVGEGCVGLSCADARKVATALEQLPALVEALKDAVKNYDIPSIAGDDFTKIQPNHWWVKAKQALEPFTDRQPEPEKVKTLENDPTIDTIGNCANCRVEFHIHKTEAGGEPQPQP